MSWDGRKRKNIPERGSKMEKGTQQSHGNGQELSVAKISDPGKEEALQMLMGPDQEKLCIIC